MHKGFNSHSIVQRGTLVLLSSLIALGVFSLLLLALPASAHDSRSMGKTVADVNDPVITAVTPLSAVAGAPFTLTITATNISSIGGVYLNSQLLVFSTTNVVDNYTIWRAHADDFFQAGVYPLTITFASNNSTGMPFTITPGLATTIVMTGAPVVAAPDDTVQVTGVISDQYSNAVQDNTLVTLTTSTPQTTTTTTSGGSFTAPVSTTTASTLYITATTGTATSTININVASAQPSKVVLTVTQPNIAAGVSTTLWVSVTDSAHKPVSGVAVTLTKSLGILGTSVLTTTSGGVASTWFSSTVAGTAHLTATTYNTQTQAEVTDNTVVTVTPASAHNVDLGIVGSPVLFTDGVQSVTLRALVSDTFGNHVAAGTLVTLTVLPVNARLSPATGATDIDGQLISTLTYTNRSATHTVTSLLTVTAAIQGDSSDSVNVSGVFTPYAAYLAAILRDYPDNISPCTARSIAVSGAISQFPDKPFRYYGFIATANYVDIQLTNYYTSGQLILYRANNGDCTQLVEPVTATVSVSSVHWLPANLVAGAAYILAVNTDVPNSLHTYNLNIGFGNSALGINSSPCNAYPVTPLGVVISQKPISTSLYYQFNASVNSYPILLNEFASKGRLRLWSIASGCGSPTVVATATIAGANFRWLPISVTTSSQYVLEVNVTGTLTSTQRYSLSMSPPITNPDNHAACGDVSLSPQMAVSEPALSDQDFFSFTAASTIYTVTVDNYRTTGNIYLWKILTNNCPTPYSLSYMNQSQALNSSSLRWQLSSLTTGTSYVLTIYTNTPYKNIAYTLGLLSTAPFTYGPDIQTGP